jgi:hypothetical protein
MALSTRSNCRDRSARSSLSTSRPFVSRPTLDDIGPRESRRAFACHWPPADRRITRLSHCHARTEPPPRQKGEVLTDPRHYVAIGVGCPVALTCSTGERQTVTPCRPSGTRLPSRNYRTKGLVPKDDNKVIQGSSGGVDGTTTHVRLRDLISRIRVAASDGDYRHG